MKIAGQRRGEVYPSAGGQGGGAAASVPLSRQRFIDGDTVQGGLNGAANQPFKTIAQFIASRTNASVADASANYVGWVTPCLAGYVENVSFPAYACTELRADSLQQNGVGTGITGNVTWTNTAGAHAASPATAGLHNITVSGGVTITDDVDAPSSSFFFGGDEITDSSAAIGGGIDTHTCTHLSSVELTNAVVIGDINCGVTADSATLLSTNSEIGGNVTAKSLLAINSAIGSAAITVKSDGFASFVDSSFVGGWNTVLTAVGGAFFDGPSWQSFIEAGGTRSPAGDTGTPVLVVGGNSGAEVEGASTSGGSGTFDLSLNGTGATVGYRGSNSGNHYAFSAQAGDATAHLKTGGGEKVGDTMLITKSDLAAHALTVTNNASVTIAVIPSGSRGFVEALFNGTDWVFLKGGSLAA